jgi:2-hydroxychromene-2-carboxylate isomerase
MKHTINIECWFDFASTYSYPTILRIESLVEKNNIKIKWKPFLLGVIFNKQGLNDSPFNIFPEKGRYMWKDIERICLDRNLPFTKPSSFPRNGLLAARICCHFCEEDWISDFIKTVLRANFELDLDIASYDVISNCLIRCNQDPNTIITNATSLTAKTKLRQQTDLAIEKGIFGAPSFIVNNELYWGDDRLEKAIHFAINQVQNK